MNVCGSQLTVLGGLDVSAICTVDTFEDYLVLDDSSPTSLEQVQAEVCALSLDELEDIFDFLTTQLQLEDILTLVRKST